MELKEFVKQTLSQIVEGAKDFETEQSKDGATIKPRMDRVPNSEILAKNGVMFAGFGTGDGIDYVTFINFDVAVTTEETGTTKKGGGIKIASIINADGSKENEISNSSVSRIQFKLPLQP